ncbi:dTDP-4-dehydrorhamnose 3,5-epimerase [Candidatus Woesebacteria bacterium]|nr:MAG: dTDP-4-dehydrorhamnose 3,5-epimerase [Candidatus Woesebacteria bacterium]
MIFKETKLKGSYTIELDKKEDERGFFARVFCLDEFKENNLNTNFVQANISMSSKKGTLRGLHFQTAPYEEDRLFRVTRGSVFDVIVDIRPDSPTYLHHFTSKLSARNYTMLYIPQGFAHGFLTLENNTEVMYMVSQFYKPEFAHGIRYNDPALNIAWPIEINVISETDKNFPDFKI